MGALINNEGVLQKFMVMSLLHATFTPVLGYISTYFTSLVWL
jgi:hypothetical protein